MKIIRTLIVDDDPDFASSLAMAVESEYCLVDIANTGEEAVEMFREREFDLVFMDIKLPGINGVQSLQEIQSFKPDTRAVMMTAYSLNDLQTQAMNIGAIKVLHKPFDLGVVIEVVRRLSQASVLIADDDQDFVESMRQLLEENRYRVTVSRNGMEAIERIDSEPVDLLILDLRMPIMNGLETYLALLENDNPLPTIIVTGYADEEREALEKLQDLAVEHVLKKPIDPKVMIQSIENCIRYNNKGSQCS